MILQESCYLEVCQTEDIFGVGGGVKEEENYHPQNTIAKRIPRSNSHWDQLQKNGCLHLFTKCYCKIWQSFRKIRRTDL